MKAVDFVDMSAIRAPLISNLFPPLVATVIASERMYDEHLFEGEDLLIQNSVRSRKREFTAGRTAARTALNALGGPVVSILARDRAPIWPAGFTGSITHCAGFCCAVVSRVTDNLSIGVDAEPATPLDRELWNMICSVDELEQFPKGDLAIGVWVKIAFCAKEAFYKCHFQTENTFFEFRDVEIAVAPELGCQKGAFKINLRSTPIPGFEGIVGRWLITDRLIITGAALPAT